MDGPLLEPIATKIVNGHEVKVYPYVAPPPDEKVWWHRRSGRRAHTSVYVGLGAAQDFFDYALIRQDQGT